MALSKPTSVFFTLAAAGALLLQLAFALVCSFWGWAGYNHAPEDFLAIAFFQLLPLLPLGLLLWLSWGLVSRLLLLPLGLLLGWELLMLGFAGLYLLAGPDLGTGSYSPSPTDYRFAWAMLGVTLLAQLGKLALLSWRWRQLLILSKF